jgi:ADP-heptose:LPS heptosyltransferase
MALLEMSSLFLGNDSGPMHLAAAMGAPVVALFGYGEENRWGPRCEKSVVLRGQERCKVCTKKECEDPVCINTLTPAAVKSAIDALLPSD